MEILKDINEIKTGDTLLVSSNSWLGKIIQKFEKNLYNHAGMFVWRGTILFVAEMVKEGLVLTNFNEYIKGKSKLLILKPIFPVNEKKYEEHIEPQLGREKYGFFNLCVAQPIKYLTNHRIWLGDVDDDNPKRLICGEFVEKEYNFHNPAYFTNWKRDAPSDIYNSILFHHFL
jgi:hypothetical protein